MLVYISFIFGFIATLLSVLGKTRKDDFTFPKNITLFGWFAIFLASSSLTTSIILKRNAEVEKDRFRFWAMRELEFSVYKLLSPYLEITDPPEKEDRFQLTRSLIEAGVFRAFCRVNIFDTCTGYDKTYAEVSSIKTKEACEELGGILSRYSNFLSSATVSLITEIRTDPWTEIMLGEHDKELKLRGRKFEGEYPFYSTHAAFQKLYIQKIDAFSLTVQNLEEHIGKEMNRISAELHIKNPEPAFLLPLDR